MNDLIVQGLTVREYNRLKEIEDRLRGNSILIRKTHEYGIYERVFYKDGAIDQKLLDHHKTLIKDIKDLEIELNEKKGVIIEITDELNYVSKKLYTYTDGSKEIVKKSFFEKYCQKWVVVTLSIILGYLLNVMIN